MAVPTTRRFVPNPSRGPFAVRQVCALAAVLCMLFLNVAPAVAAPLSTPTWTLHLSAHPSRQAFLMTVTGTYASFPAVVYVYVQSGTTACASQWPAENRRVEQQMQRLGLGSAAALISQELGMNGTTSGPYSIQGYWGVNARVGQYRVCAYLTAPSGTGGPSGVISKASASLVLTVGKGTQPSSGSTSHIEVLDFYTISLHDYYRYWVADVSGAPDNSASPVARFPRGTTSVGLQISVRHVTRKIDNVRFVFRNKSTGVTFRSGPDFIPGSTFAAVTAGRCFNWGGADCYAFKGNTGSRVRPTGAFPPGTYRLDMLVDGHSVANTSFTISR